jgi:hypothetical protein
VTGLTGEHQQGGFSLSAIAELGTECAQVERAPIAIHSFAPALDLSELQTRNGDQVTKEGPQGIVSPREEEGTVEIRGVRFN